MMPRKENVEDNMLKKLITNSEATMGSDVSRSVGIAINKLEKVYGKTEKSLLSEKKIKEANKANCVKGLEQLQAKDFFYAEEKISHDDPLFREIDTELSQLVTFIIEKMNEIDDALDRVTLYNPKTEAEEEFIFPIEYVLPLIWRALHDDSKFSHHYNGTEAEKLKQASNDLPLRLLSLFRCFQRIEKGICHHGVRNELVLLLNETWGDIKVIEDQNVAIIDFMKEKLYRNFLLVWQDNNDQEKHFKISEAFLLWIEDDNSTKLMELIDPEQKIQKELKDFLISHGINPENISITNKDINIPFGIDIDDQLGKKFFVFREVLSMSSTTLSEDKFYLLKKKIKEDFIVNESGFFENLTILRNILLTYKEISKAKIILITTGKMTEEELTDLKNKCDDALDEFIGTGNIKQAIDLRDPTKRFNELISESRKDNLTNFVENFFVNWNSAIELDDSDGMCPPQLRILFNFLTQEESLGKIIASKNFIEQLNSDFNISMEIKGYASISAYEINRILLTALLTDPRSWETDFHVIFEHILKFIQDEDNTQANAVNLDLLKKSSYTADLLNQLNELNQEYLNKDTEEKNESKRFLPDVPKLPDQIRTLDDFVYFGYIAGPERAQKVYLSKRVMFKEILKNTDEDLKSDVCISLLGGNNNLYYETPLVILKDAIAFGGDMVRNDILRYLVDNFSKDIKAKDILINLMPISFTLQDVLREAPIEDRLNYVKELKEFINPDQLIEMLSSLSVDDRFKFIKEFKTLITSENFITVLRTIGLDYSSFLDRDFPDQKEIILQIIIMFEKLITEENFADIFKLIYLKDSSVYSVEFALKFKEFITERNFLDILKVFHRDDAIKFVENFSSFISKENFVYILGRITTDDLVEFAGKFKEFITEENFIEVLKQNRFDNTFVNFALELAIESDKIITNKNAIDVFFTIQPMGNRRDQFINDFKHLITNSEILRKDPWKYSIDPDYEYTITSTKILAECIELHPSFEDRFKLLTRFEKFINTSKESDQIFIDKIFTLISPEDRDKFISKNKSSLTESSIPTSGNRNVFFSQSIEAKPLAPTGSSENLNLKKTNT